jgi:hypothetical protein
MPRVCTACTSPNREAIDRALVAETPLRTIADQYGVSKTALLRHKADHLPAALAKGKEAKEEAHALGLVQQLERWLERVNLLFDACDRWLRDPEDPSRYDIGPRAEDLKVTYTELVNGKPVQRKRKLSELLAEIEGSSRTVELVETKHADPRELILKTHARLQSNQELIARLLGELKEGATVNLLIAPEWMEVRAVLLSELVPYPEARQAVAAALARAEGHARN